MSPSPPVTTEVVTEPGSNLPSDVVNTLVARLTTLFPEHAVIGRSLRGEDPHLAIGITFQGWQPKEDSQEIGGLEPTLNTYEVDIQNLVLASDESVGLKVSAGIAKMLRVALYRDQQLRVSLLELSDSSFGFVERVRRMGVSRQNFTAGEVRGVWTYLAVARMWLETETRPL